NDFACRFVNGEGLPGGRVGANACTVFEDGEYKFVDQTSTTQFCAVIAEPFAFPIGDTIVTARVHDAIGQPGAPASFVVRIL
ncbi:hypothetical protein NL533_34755, partial [Klebsiella pneumoniae]|nr:hypothetical protein [Klebsiella pneumoniae]